MWDGEQIYGVLLFHFTTITKFDYGMLQKKLSTSLGTFPSSSQMCAGRVLKCENLRFVWYVHTIQFRKLREASGYNWEQTNLHYIMLLNMCAGDGPLGIYIRSQSIPIES